ncbi:hypothetical protein KP003_11640 [Geomonas nitrogeniifigens]|uniref:Methionyl-tRNA formyltransferase n=1 Tax=Geomonas diazotrophica TaxID=2843197 RepID=A0ABX8JEF7_9BACT|nr:formyltransferase family protein [Geomonas nitrogeniifigens]QWV95984.1 hypothetical protein KP005_11365 [Geomonas nitrogeniifigens]QXE85051.1 hypothetical protein KP003_11640 [Geomonas nitrogeniifigens]
MPFEDCPKLLILCTARTGLDAVAELLRRGIPVKAIVGVHPDSADPVKMSGWIDIASFAERWNIPYRHVRTYGLSAPEDRKVIEEIDFDLVWVAGWQRLVPQWLIASCRYGVLGGHGSPDGIHGGRGRSPQNWALMLGCKRFDLSLFQITVGIDDGPILATRSFFYADGDDIAVSYYRCALAMADMVAGALADPSTLLRGVPQPSEGFYYPQRKPEDGWVDWTLPQATICSHCRALSKPYPGLKTSHEERVITIWNCHPFDDVIEAEEGVISACFESGEFLVNCVDGRLLIRQWEADDPGWNPVPGTRLSGVKFAEQLNTIVARHYEKYPELKVSRRIARLQRG